MNLSNTHQDFYQSGREVIKLEEAVKQGMIWDLTAVHWGLPDASAGYASNRPVFMLSGPGIKKNIKGNKCVNLVDVAPTLAYILGIYPPNQSEGRIVWEAFQSMS